MSANVICIQIIFVLVYICIKVCLNVSTITADLELIACLWCLCLSGFSAAAAADRGQNVVRTSGGWSRCQTTPWCWSSSLRSERSYIHRYFETNSFIQRNFLRLICVRTLCLCVVVEGGQRAIIFNRIGGMQMTTVLAEGLHFRYHC